MAITSYLPTYRGMDAPGYCPCGTKRRAVVWWGGCQHHDGADMTLIPQTFRGGLILSALALTLFTGGAMAQGYSGQNGGSSTMQGQGTRGGSDVDGSGQGGPRSKMQQPYNTTNPSATRPGVATAPSPRSNTPKSRRSDTEDPNMNPQHGNGH